MHGLSYAHGRRQVKNNLNATESRGQSLAVAHVALNEFDFGGQISRSSVRVNLLRQIVEYPDLMSALEQRVCQMRAHKAGATSDQDSLAHYSTPACTLNSRRAGAYRRTAQVANSAKSSILFGGLV